MGIEYAILHVRSRAHDWVYDLSTASGVSYLEVESHLDALNAAGRDGWELVTHQTMPDGNASFYFKRSDV